MKEGKSVKFKLHQQQQQQNGHVSPFKFTKLFDPEASWDKDQLGDVLHWIRQVVALACGLLWGAVPFVGAIWILIMGHDLKHCGEESNRTYGRFSRETELFGPWFRAEAFHLKSWPLPKLFTSYEISGRSKPSRSYGGQRIRRERRYGHDCRACNPLSMKDVLLSTLDKNDSSATNGDKPRVPQEQVTVRRVYHKIKTNLSLERNTHQKESVSRSICKELEGERCPLPHPKMQKSNTQWKSAQYTYPNTYLTKPDKMAQPTQDQADPETKAQPIPDQLSSPTLPSKQPISSKLFFSSSVIKGPRFLVLSSGIIYGYYAIILKIDEEDFGGHGTLLQEGLFASLTLFLLAWILVYSLVHF
ncbi:hypothetical protein HHK36_018426 [Tetracentron sinense]|uniref:Uncharacterized protein n=1 Tax=Tetracentron sinense TaxID=13715 RepID=A0A835DAU2_TETSI|nr:hypothetical protein HHK36_018426 [Tetracentron sinense]